MHTVPPNPPRCRTCQALMDPATGGCAHHGTAPPAQQPRQDSRQAVQARREDPQPWLPVQRNPQSAQRAAWSLPSDALPVHRATPAPQGPWQAPNPAGVPMKSAGVAVLLSFLWLGAGHLYAERIGTGIALLVFDALLWLLALSFVGAIVAVPIWLVAMPLAMVSSAAAARDFNDRERRQADWYPRLG